MKNKLFLMMAFSAAFLAIPYVAFSMNDPLEDTDIDDFMTKRLDEQYLDQNAVAAEDSDKQEEDMMPMEDAQENAWSPEGEDLSDEALAEYGEYPEEDYMDEDMMPEEDEDSEYWYPEDDMSDEALAKSEENELPEQNEVEEVEEMMPQEEVNERDARMM